MKKLLYITFALSALFLMASCERQLTVYEPDEGEVCASFLTDVSIKKIDVADGNKFSVDLYRGITAAAATVPVIVVDNDHFFPHESIFDATNGYAPVVKGTLYFIDGTYTALSFATTTDGTPEAIDDDDVEDGYWVAEATGFLFVAGSDATTIVECMEEVKTCNFAAGESKATLSLDYPDINDYPYGEVYTVSLYIADPDQLSPSGYDAIDVKLTRKATLVAKGTGVWTSEAFGSWPQPLSNLAEDPNMYTLTDLFTEGYDVYFKYEGGNVVFPSAINTYIMYDEASPSVGTYYFYVLGADVAAGVVTITSYLALPAVSYVFGQYDNFYQLPEGFSF